MPSILDLCGWKPDELRIADFASANGNITSVAPQLLTTEKRDVFLWQALLDVLPTWQRAAQGIGDCVSWGAELLATVQMAIQHAKGTSRFIAEAATESIYGGCRVEAQGKRRGGRSDGAFGAGAAKWLRDWGTLLRIDYSQQTGNPEHDLRRYSKDKAKDWGDYGCGGMNDKDALDNMARETPVKHCVQVRNVDEAAAAIMNGYGVTIASSKGFGNMRRNADGICRIIGTWMHQMYLGGIRWWRGEAQFRCFQSWGPKTCSGPDPGIDSKAVSGCSWWVTSQDADSIFRSGDCWAMGDIVGLPQQKLDFLEASKRWYQPELGDSHQLAV